MMAEELLGKTLDEAARLQDRVHELLHEEGEPGHWQSDLLSLQGVRKFPARIKCATLPWETFRDACQSGTSPELH
jgi:nitrogen fixation NifU-like protein